MSRPVVLGLYALLVLIWSSTWVAIRIGVDDVPPLYGAGVRFTLAGAGLLVLCRVLRRPGRSDPLLVAVLASLAITIGWFACRKRIAELAAEREGYTGTVPVVPSPFPQPRDKKARDTKR